MRSMHSTASDFNPHFLQMVLIVLVLHPVRADSGSTRQGPPSAGVLDTVIVTRRSTVALVTAVGLPGRLRSSNPSNP